MLRRRYEAMRTTVDRLRNARHDFGLADRQKLSIFVPAPLSRQPECSISWPACRSGDSRRRRKRRPRFDEMMSAIRVKAPTAQLRERYSKELTRLRAEVERGEKKLASESFVSRAPADVVAKEREKLDGYRRDLERTERLLVEVSG